jgi:glc operon protein GlcG
MTRRLSIASAFLAATGFAQTLGAQAPGAQQQQGNIAQAAPQLIDLATAKKMVAAAEALATKEGSKVGIAVVDANGDLVYLLRMDGSSPRGPISSQGKARAAILYGLPTKAVRDAINSGKPVTAKLSLNGVDVPEVTINQGGLPIFKDGKLIGGIGAGGTASADDERYAQAGLDAAFPTHKVD